MSILLTLGFERKEITSERFIVATGSVDYSSNTSGAGSEASLHVLGETEAVKPFFAVYEFWLFFRLKRTASGGIQIGVTDPYDTSLMVIFDAGTLSVEIAGVEISSVVIPTDNQWHSYHIHANTYFEDEFVRVYVDGDLNSPVLETTGEGMWGFAAPGHFLVKGTSEADYLLDDVVIVDPTDGIGLVDILLMKSPTIKCLLATEDGEKATQTSGDYTDIATLPPNFTNKLVYEGYGQESTFFPAVLEVTEPILGKTVWERHVLNSIYYGNSLKLQLNIPSDADLYSSDKPLLEEDFLTNEPIYAVEHTFEEGINGPYVLASFNEEEFGWKLTGEIVGNFCDSMHYLKQEDINLGVTDLFVYACESEVLGTTPVEIWVNGLGGEGYDPINFDSPVGDPSKINFVEVGGKHFVQTDKSGGLESVEVVESTGDTTQIYGSFVIRNVPASQQLVFAVGNNAGSFSIKANSDQTLTVSGVATPIAYEIDKVYVFYAFSSAIDEGADSVFFLDGTEYVCEIDHFETTGERIYLGSSGALDGVTVDHIMYFLANRTEAIGPVNMGYFFLFTDLIATEYDYEPGFGKDLFPDVELGLFVYSGGIEAIYETPIGEVIDYLYLDLQTILPAMAAR